MLDNMRDINTEGTSQVIVTDLSDQTNDVAINSYNNDTVI